MKLAITSNGADLHAQASPVFGRCPNYVFVDTETMEFEAVGNPAMGSPSGAGIQAAQFIVERGAEAVVTGNMGPNAFNVFQSAGVPIYLFGGGTVRQAAEAFKAGELQSIADASTEAGMGMGRGRGAGRRSRMPGMGMGRQAAGPSRAPMPPSMPGMAGSQSDDLAEIKGMLASLRKQLADVTDRLDQLEKERS